MRRLAQHYVREVQEVRTCTRTRTNTYLQDLEEQKRTKYKINSYEYSYTVGFIQLHRHHRAAAVRADMLLLDCYAIPPT